MKSGEWLTSFGGDEWSPALTIRLIIVLINQHLYTPLLTNAAPVHDQDCYCAMKCWTDDDRSIARQLTREWAMTLPWNTHNHHHWRHDRPFCNIMNLLLHGHYRRSESILKKKRKTCHLSRLPTILLHHIISMIAPPHYRVASPQLLRGGMTTITEQSMYIERRNYGTAFIEVMKQRRVEIGAPNPYPPPVLPTRLIKTNKTTTRAST
jgi:hypothetical protein